MCLFISLYYLYCCTIFHFKLGIECYRLLGVKHFLFISNSTATYALVSSRTHKVEPPEVYDQLSGLLVLVIVGMAWSIRRLYTQIEFELNRYNWHL